MLCATALLLWLRIRCAGLCRRGLRLAGLLRLIRLLLRLVALRLRLPTLAQLRALGALLRLVGGLALLLAR